MKIDKKETVDLLERLLMEIGTEKVLRSHQNESGFPYDFYDLNWCYERIYQTKQFVEKNYK